MAIPSPVNTVTQAKSVAAAVGGAIKSTPNLTGSKGGPIFVFPRDLRSSTAKYPCAQFTVSVKENANGKVVFKHIFLPMPPGGLTFSETGEYGTMDLGVIAAAGGMDALNKMMNSPSAENLVAGVKSTSSNILNQIKNLNSGAIGTIAGTMLGQGEGAQFAGKKIMSPNTNTTFKGNSIRSFQFSFKLVGRDKKDSEAIRNIHNLFREAVYAAGDSASNIILSYPPVWAIKFLDGGKENPYIPKIFGCYLKTCTADFNTTTNIFRPDGAPIEVDISLGFEETRMLTRNDIKELNAGSTVDNNRGIDPDTGLAITSVSDDVKSIDLKATADAKVNAEKGGSSSTRGSDTGNGLSDGANGRPWGTSKGQ